MSNGALQVLMIEDNSVYVELFHACLSGYPAAGHEFTYCKRLGEAIELLGEDNFDIVILDLGLPDSQGLETFLKLRDHATGTPVLIMTGLDDEETATEAVQRGAQDYLIKGEADGRALMRAMRYAVERTRISEELRKAHDELEVRVEEQTSELAQANEALGKSNRALRVLSACNQAVVRARNERDLAEEVCWNLVEQTGYRLTWIGLAEHDRKKTVRPLAQHGFDEGYLAKAGIVWADTTRGRGPTGKAIRTGKTVVARNIISDPRHKTWRAEALKLGYASMLALPVRLGQQTIGALTIYAAQPNAFDDEEVKLLSEIAEDLSFGIESIRTRDERRRGEEALRRSEAKFRMFFHSAGDAIFIHDLEGRILEVNQAACDHLGYRREDLLEMTLMDVDSPVAAAKTHESFEQLTRARNLRFEGEHATREGKVLPVDLNIRLVEYEGKPAAMAIARDITERKEAEAEKNRLEAMLSRSQKMEAIGTLAGGIAHDFNNILAIIIGFTELSLPKAPEETELQVNLREVLKAGFRARDLVQQILAFSRQVDHGVESVAINPLAKEVLKFLKASAPSSIELRQDFAAECLVMADPTQMHQVIMNLCTNAIQAMENKGGCLEVGLSVDESDSATCAQFPTLGPGPFVRLTVSDTGPGMPPEIVDRIFEPYFTTKGEGEGTGLGLAVVHGIVEGHGGAIKVYSEPDQGTTFHVFLPAAPGEAASEADSEALIPSEGEKGILFVDDEEAIVNITRQMLEKMGHRVTATTSPAEALEMFSARPGEFDLVITDTTMPEMNGDQLAEKLMGVRPDVPMVICTGFSRRISEEKARDMGIRGFIMKPFGLNELRRVIHNVLDLGEALEPGG